MNIDIELVKEIRQQTELSVGQIRKALEQANGDKAGALEILKSSGAAVAEKKSSRTTGEGLVVSYIHSNKKLGVLVELLCETDFVARNPQFQELGHDIAMQIAAMDSETVDKLLDEPSIKDSSLTVRDLLQQGIAKLGENIKIGQFVRFQI